MTTASQKTLHVLEQIVKVVPVGTNLALLQLMWAMITGRNLQKPRSREQVPCRPDHLSEDAYLTQPVSQQLSAGFMIFRSDDQSSAAAEDGEDNRKLPVASQDKGTSIKGAGAPS